MIPPLWAFPSTLPLISPTPGSAQSRGSMSHMIVISPSERRERISDGLIARTAAATGTGVKPVAFGSRRRLLELRASARPASSAGHVGMAPGVVADHVAVGEHPPLDRAVGVVRRDLLADLEERRRHVLARQHVEEVDRRRRAPWTVVERQRDLVDVAWARCRPARTRRNAPDETRHVELRRTSASPGRHRRASSCSRAPRECSPPRSGC